MFWSRLGSLNALEEHRLSRFWKQWLGCSPGSSDTLGRVHAGLVAHELREGLHHVYFRLKRNKALPDIGGLGVAVLDGHETHASYRRRCSDACSGRFTPSKAIGFSTTIGTSLCSC